MLSFAPFRSLVVLAFSAGALMALPPFPEQLFPELDPLMESARNAAPAIQSQYYYVQETEGNMIVDAAARRPKVGLSGRIAGAYEYRDDLVGNETNALLDAHIYLRQPVYHWGRLDAQRRIGQLRNEAAKAALARTTGEVMTDVREQYMQAVLAKLQLQVAENGAALAATNLESQEKLFREGRVPELRLLETRLAVQDYAEMKASAEGRLSLALSQLSALTGSDVKATALDLEKFPTIPLLASAEISDLRSSIKAPGASFSNETSFHLLSQAVEEENYKIISTRTKPTIDFIAGGTQDQVDGFGTTERATRVYAFAGLQVNWNIYDGAEAKGLRLASLARQRMSEFRAQRARTDEERQRLFLLNDVEVKLRQVAARQQRVELIGQRLRVAEQQASRGEISSLELLRQRQDYAGARYALAESLVYYLNQITRLRVILHGDPKAPATHAAASL